MGKDTRQTEAKPNQSLIDQLQPGAGADTYAAIRQNAREPTTGRWLKFRLITAVNTRLRELQAGN